MLDTVQFALDTKVPIGTVYVRIKTVALVIA